MFKRVMQILGVIATVAALTGGIAGCTAVVGAPPPAPEAEPEPLLPLPAIALEKFRENPGWHFVERNGVGYAGFAQSHPDGKYTIWIVANTTEELLAVGCLDGPSPDGIPERCEPLKHPYRLPLDEGMLLYLQALAALIGEGEQDLMQLGSI